MIKRKSKDILNIVYNLLSISSLFIYTCSGMEYSSCNKLWGVTQDANGKMLYKVGMYMCIDDPYKIYKNMQSISGATMGRSISTIPSITTNNISNLLNTTNISPMSNENLTKDVGLNMSLGVINKENYTTDTTTTTTYYAQTTTLAPSQTTTTTPAPSQTTTLTPSHTTTPTPSHTTTPTSSQTTTHVSTNIKPYNSKELDRDNYTYGGNNTNVNLNNLRSTKNVSENNTNDILIIVLIFVCICIVNVVVCSYLYLRYKKIRNLNSKIEHENADLPLPPPPPIINKVQPSKNKTKLPRDVNMIIPKKTIDTHLKVDTSKPARELKLNHKALTPNTRKIFDTSVVSMQSWYEDTFKNELGYNSKNIPKPPSKHVETMKPPQKSTAPSKNNELKLKSNVKRLIHKKEQEIKKFNKNGTHFAQ
tara:strand:- start:3214 stop:4473 length:1260 start_codon:yes stop_codon:yes gene_type:complete